MTIQSGINAPVLAFDNQYTTSGTGQGLIGSDVISIYSSSKLDGMPFESNVSISSLRTNLGEFTVDSGARFNGRYFSARKCYHYYIDNVSGLSEGLTRGYEWNSIITNANVLMVYGVSGTPVAIFRFVAKPKQI